METNCRISGPADFRRATLGNNGDAGQTSGTVRGVNSRGAEQLAGERIRGTGARGDERDGPVRRTETRVIAPQERTARYAGSKSEISAETNEPRVGLCCTERYSFIEEAGSVASRFGYLLIFSSSLRPLRTLRAICDLRFSSSSSRLKKILNRRDRRAPCNLGT